MSLLITLFKVLCQPRVTTPEVKADGELLSRTFQIPRSISYTKKASGHLNGYDNCAEQEHLSTVTASTSFDSTTPTINGTTTKQNEKKIEHDSVRQLSETRLCWFADTELPVSWKAEINQLFMANGHAEHANNNEENELKLVGVAKFQPTYKYQLNNDAENQVFANGYGTFSNPNAVTLNHADDSTQVSTQCPSQPTLYQPYQCSKEFQSRGTLASLSYVMCRACGLPVDTLIPSIQKIRELSRRHYCSFQSSNPSRETGLSVYNIFRTNNGELSNVSNSLLTERQNTVQCLDESGFPDPYSTILAHTVSNRSIVENPYVLPNSSSGNNSQSAPSNVFLCTPSCCLHQFKPRRFVNWYLEDFYDLFLLDLPDICPGCLKGCQFCKGAGLI